MGRQTDKCYTAQLLWEMDCDETNRAYILFLIPVLNEVQRVNFSFESNEADPTILLDDLTMVIKVLINMICLPTKRVDPFEGDIRLALDPRLILDGQFKKMREMSQMGFSI